MKKDELIELLQRQVEYLQGKLNEALGSVNSLTTANEKLTQTVKELRATIEELRKQITSLEDMLKGKGAEPEKEKAALQAVQRLQGTTSERQSKPMLKPSVTEQSKEKKKGAH